MEPARSLAGSLRDLRTRAKVSTYELASRLGWSQSRVTRMERGQAPVTPEDVAAWADAVGADHDTAAALMAQAEDAANQMRSWREVHGKGLASRQREMAAIHSTMTNFREFAHACVPGLLQTPAYAARILELADVAGRGGVAEAAAQRINNQAILYDPARSFEFVLTEAALRYRAGPAPMMRAQADKIIGTMTLPSVSISVIPFTAEPAALYVSGFVIYEIPDAPFVLVEVLSIEQQLGSAWDLQLYRETFARLQGTAVTGVEAEALITTSMTVLDTCQPGP
jgi:transcriptional regulator with XRE-family HTH domain